MKTYSKVIETPEELLTFIGEKQKTERRYPRLHNTNVSIMGISEFNGKIKIMLVGRENILFKSGITVS